MKALIVTTQRTGSTFLVTCLDSHPQVRCIGELLIGATRPLNTVPRILRRHWALANLYRIAVSGAWRPKKTITDFYAGDEVPVMAFKVMYNQLARHPRAFAYLRDDSTIRVIHLARRNYLAQYVSKRLAQRRNVWRSQDVLPVMTVRVTVEQARREIDKGCAQTAHYARAFATHPKIELVYETMTNGATLSPAAATAVHTLLELDGAPMMGKGQKSSPYHLRDLIENYCELEQAFAGTPYSAYLDDAFTNQHQADS